MAESHISTVHTLHSKSTPIKDAQLKSHAPAAILKIFKGLNNVWPAYSLISRYCFKKLKIAIKTSLELELIMKKV